MRTRESGDAYGPAWSGPLRPERHRQRVLSVLQGRELPMSIAELAGLVLDQREGSTAKSARNEEVLERIRVRLHHVDLPKLQDEGELVYDETRNVVSACFDRESE